jgi:hypothetical protein
MMSMKDSLLIPHASRDIAIGMPTQVARLAVEFHDAATKT